MAQQTLSTTRQRLVTIPPNSRIVVDFPDTKPNYFYLNNLSVSEVYLGVTMIPDQVRYDKMVGPSQETIFARDQGVTSIQLFNGTGAEAVIDLTTFEKEFDPNVLASASVSVSGSGGGGGDFDGIIRGFTAPLPAGNNDIGKVIVSQMPAITVEQGPLPEGNANIGKVQVTSLPSLPTGSATIGNVGVVGGVTIDSMPAVSLNGDVTLADNATFAIKGASQYYHYNASVGTTEVVVSLGFEATNFKYISNDDSANDLLIAFNTGVTTGSENGLGGVIRLKPGETLQELNVKATTIKFRRAAGTGNVRFVGV